MEVQSSIIYNQDRTLNSDMADMQNVVKVALRKQIKSVVKLMTLENRVEQSNKITQKVLKYFNIHNNKRDRKLRRK